MQMKITVIQDVKFFVTQNMQSRLQAILMHIL